MATYTPTGIAVAGASYPQKAGSGVSAFVPSGTDARTAIDAGSAVSVRTGSATDATTWTDTGSATSAFVGSGATERVALTYLKAGTGVSGKNPIIKAGSATSARVASASDARTAVDTGKGVLTFTTAVNPTYPKAGTAISGERFSYPKTGVATSARVASGAKVRALTSTKTGSGISARVPSGARAGSSGKTGGNMTPPYGSFAFGDEDYGEDTYGGFRNDARRIASGTYVVTSPPNIMTGQGVSAFRATGADVVIHAKSGTASSEFSVAGPDATESGETGGTMVPPYGSTDYGDGAYGAGYYGGFRNDGRRIASGFAEKELNREGAGILNLTGNGFFIPPFSEGDVEITDDDDIMLAIDELLSGDVVLTVTES